MEEWHLILSRANFNTIKDEITNYTRSSLHDRLYIKDSTVFYFNLCFIIPYNDQNLQPDKPFGLECNLLSKFFPDDFYCHVFDKVAACFPTVHINFQAHIVDLPPFQGFHWHVKSRITVGAADGALQHCSALCVRDVTPSTCGGAVWQSCVEDDLFIWGNCSSSDDLYCQADNWFIQFHVAQNFPALRPKCFELHFGLRDFTCMQNSGTNLFAMMMRRNVKHTNQRCLL